ncbi:hypothetical protein LOZ37_006849, partial [Ophidiomyces ophidiicola]
DDCGRPHGDLRQREYQRPVPAGAARLGDRGGDPGPDGAGVDDERAGVRGEPVRGDAAATAVPQAPGAGGGAGLRAARQQLRAGGDGRQRVRAGDGGGPGGGRPAGGGIPEPVELAGAHEHGGVPQGVPRGAGRQRAQLERLQGVLRVLLPQGGGGAAEAGRQQQQQRRRRRR